MELHIITVCVAILAIEPARKLWRPVSNWWVRQRLHREHMKRLEREHG